MSDNSEPIEPTEITSPVKITEEKRADHLTRFDGTPGPGRPKGVPNKIAAKVKRIYESYTEEAARECYEIAFGRRKYPIMARIKCIEIINERGLGKVPQPLTGVDGGAIEVVLSARSIKL